MLFFKTIVFFAIAFVGVSCYAVFWNKPTDCAKDLSCKKFTTTLTEAFVHESLDGQKIKEIAKANGFKYVHEHIYGKIAPYEIGRNIYFEQRGNIFLTNTSVSKNKLDYKDIFSSEYKEGVAYFSIAMGKFPAPWGGILVG